MSADKTLEILDLYGFNTKQLSVQEMSNQLNLPASSIYRYIRILKNKGYLQESVGDTYKLGYRFLEMANIVKAESSLSTIALPFMKYITSKTGETSILTVISGYYAVCLETVTSYHSIKVSAEQGSILPLFAGASSKTLLAYQPKEFINELFVKGYVKQLTSNTITDPENLEKNLKGIRENGYSISDEEVDKMVFAYGVPIMDTNQNLVAALSLAGPKARILEKEKGFYINYLREAAQNIQKSI
jgi:DNA-binding IclR family transcriptional regulator